MCSSLIITAYQASHLCLYFITHTKVCVSKMSYNVRLLATDWLSILMLTLFIYKKIMQFQENRLN